MAFGCMTSVTICSDFGTQESKVWYIQSAKRKNKHFQLQLQYIEKLFKDESKMKIFPDKQNLKESIITRTALQEMAWESPARGSKRMLDNNRRNNILSRFVTAFLPRSNGLLISWLQSPSAVILEPKRVKSLTVSTVSLSIYHEVIGPDAMIFIFWRLSFKQAFWLSSFTFIKRLFSFSLLSAIRMVSSAYLRLLIFLLAILIPACTSSSLAFHMMYSAYELNKQDDNI